MAEGRRPGGLTALAVINFIWGGLSALGALAMAAAPAILKAAADANPDDEEIKQAIEAFEQIGPVYYLILAAVAATALLLILSGIGYLKQKRVLGRMLGNAYAILSIVHSLAQAFALPDDLEGGFDISTIIGLIYPVLTLILLNTTFKEDLVN